MRKIRFFLLLLSALLVSCGANIYDKKADSKDDRYYMEEAQIYLNKSQYDKADLMLEKVKNHSKEYTLLKASSTLGEAGFSLWDLLLDVVDSLTSQSKVSSSGGGINQVFELLSDSVFGTGSARTTRLTAILGVVDSLKSLEDKDLKTEGIRCFLTGLMVLPNVNDGTSALLTATASLQELESNVGGSGSSKDECPGIDSFEIAMTTLNKVQTDFSYVLEQTSTCPMLDFLNTASSDLNDVQVRLAKFTAAADKGCSNPCSSSDATVLAACQALQLGCVQEIISDATAKAGDGLINRCELITNCMTGGCF